MKNPLIVLLTLVLVFSCKERQTSRTPVEVQSKTYHLFGDTFNPDSMISIDKLPQNISNMGDTLQLALKGTIKEVCTKKGCWMKLSMANNSELMVRFKDYGFFVPLDASGEVIVHGNAFLSETSVEDLRHYAEDAGASAEEIAAIIAPKISYNFEADGVLIAE